MKKVSFLGIILVLFGVANYALALEVKQELTKAKTLAANTAKEQKGNTISGFTKPSTMNNTTYKKEAKGAMADIRIRLAELKSVRNRSLAQNIEILLLEYDVEYLDGMSK